MLWIGVGFPAFAAAEFWNDKDPSTWLERECARLLTNSPWAKETSFAAGAPGLEGTYTEAGRADPTNSGRGVGATPGGMSGSRPGGSAAPGGQDQMRKQPRIRMLVRWDSATVMRLAARKPVPPLASQYYIVTVSGSNRDQWPEDSEGSETRKQLEGQLKQVTELVRKRKDPLHPERLEVLDKEGQRTVVFLFSRTPEPLTLEDKEVTLVSAGGAVPFRVRFPLKEMVYRGKLDL